MKGEGGESAAAAAGSGSGSGSELQQQTKRKRGRPRKLPVSGESADVSKPKRGRGRPKGSFAPVDQHTLDKLFRWTVDEKEIRDHVKNQSLNQESFVICWQRRPILIFRSFMTRLTLELMPTKVLMRWLLVRINILLLFFSLFLI